MGNAGKYPAGCAAGSGCAIMSSVEGGEGYEAQAAGPGRLGFSGLPVLPDAGGAAGIPRAGVPDRDPQRKGVLLADAQGGAHPCVRRGHGVAAAGAGGAALRHHGKIPQEALDGEAPPRIRVVCGCD